MKNLFNHLFANSTQTKEKPSSDIAVAALMIEVLSADDQIDERETAHSLKLLASRYRLDTKDIQACYDKAQSERQSAIDLHQFTSLICKEFSHEERLSLLSELWQIALIDEDLDRHERHTIRKIAALLYLNDREIIQCLEKAKKLVSQ